MSKHFSKTEFEYPVHRICGKISRKSKVIHRCTINGKQITYLQGERDLTAHPITQDELDSQRISVAQGATLRRSLRDVKNVNVARAPPI